MKITIISDVPGYVFEVGKTYDVPNHQAHELIKAGHARAGAEKRGRKRVQSEGKDAADSGAGDA